MRCALDVSVKQEKKKSKTLVFYFSLVKKMRKWSTKDKGEKMRGLIDWVRQQRVMK